jgi:hypothetical protein
MDEIVNDQCHLWEKVYAAPGDPAAVKTSPLVVIHILCAKFTVAHSVDLTLRLNIVDLFVIDLRFIGHC